MGFKISIKYVYIDVKYIKQSSTKKSGIIILHIDRLVQCQENYLRQYIYSLTFLQYLFCHIELGIFVHILRQFHHDIRFNADAVNTFAAGRVIFGNGQL